MKIHEYQGKQLFRQAGVSVLEGHIARTPDEAADAYRKLGGSIAVVKAQIHAGGRGKGTIKDLPDQRGVQLVKAAEDAKTVAARLLGHELVTIQTGPEGQRIGQVLIEAGCDIDRELYCAIVLDRAIAKPVIMVSPAGGMDIEKVAEETPEKLYREPFSPSLGLMGYQVRKLCDFLDLKGTAAKQADKFFKALCKLFVEKDCSMVEVNPLVVTKTGELIALDAKLTFDDNALFRHPDVKAMEDLAEEEPLEVRAAAKGLNYVKLDGEIACLVNGAGLAMATMDIIKHHGGSPANFLDVGGGADEDQVTEAFRIILSDPNVKAVLVNIFGGIMRCTTIAAALIAAYKTVGFNVPLVVRLEGTEVEAGRKMLADSGIKVIVGDDLADAAKKVVASLKK
jgi:succinyl-CoA synthetase beta subunit